MSVIKNVLAINLRLEFESRTVFPKLTDLELDGMIL